MVWGMDTAPNLLSKPLVEGLTLGTLTPQQAQEIFHLGEEAVVSAFLLVCGQVRLLREEISQLRREVEELKAHLASLNQQLSEERARRAAESYETPSTPSGMKPPYRKPPPEAPGKTPGQKQGHPGHRRAPPSRIDQRKEYRLSCCPFCGGPVKRCRHSRTRYTEDIPQGQPVVTEHVIYRHWCPRCRKQVEPAIPDALPGATLGNRVLVLSAWLHYGLGITLSQMVSLLDFHLQMKLSAGGLLRMWYRLQAILYAWYQQIQEQALQSPVLHADETGWRVNGRSRWLWCFTTASLTYYMIHASRGSPALKQFFLREYLGTLVSDFWAAYNLVLCPMRQTCLVHLLRAIEHVELYQAPGEDWPEFAQSVRQLVKEAIQLWRDRSQMDEAAYVCRRQELTARLAALLERTWQDRHAQRLGKRLQKHREHLLTFLDQEPVPFDNNAAERALRPAVIQRKNSYGNRSEKGADGQAVFMSIFRTLKQRGHDPIQTIVDALSTYLTTGTLPPLPPPKTTPIG